jgi:hypothetical protein
MRQGLRSCSPKALSKPDDADDVDNGTCITAFGLSYPQMHGWNLREHFQRD